MSPFKAHSKFVLAGLMLLLGGAFVVSAVTSRSSEKAPLDPALFGLPADAREAMELRTDNAATFEVSPGKFAAVGGVAQYVEQAVCEEEGVFFCFLKRVGKALLADASGPNSPGTIVDDDSVGTIAWTNPSNAISSDDSYAATDAIIYTQQSHYLKATNFGFSIPVGATIDGILVEVERTSVGMAGVSDAAARIVKSDGAIGTTDNMIGSWNPTENYYSYGSSFELWGEDWTAEDINDDDFGFAISAIGIGGSSQRSARIDHIRITVSYTEADSAPPVPSNFSPASESTITDATQNVTFDTDENATCKISLTDQAYGDMAGDACTGGGTQSQSCTTPDLGADGAKTVYIACTDGTNADIAETNEALSYALDTTPPTLAPVPGSSEGPNSPGTVADDASVGTAAWNNPTNASESDNSNTYSYVEDADTTTHYLKANNFNLGNV
ncbi:MAG: hypothetical protein PHW10_05625 [Candidatus Peribacteraceae bacterium]|nr:hypothetical protein [Candidatus Peribacteraceae bacterium]